MGKRPAWPAMLSIAFLILILIAFSTRAFADTATYDFSSCDSAAPGQNCWMYADDVDQFPFGYNSGNRNTHSEASAANYTAVSTSNDARYTTADPGNSDEIFLWLEMYINEDRTKVYQIDFTFEGHLNNSTTNFSTWVLADGAAWTSDADWLQLGADESITSNTDTTYTRSLTSNFTSYINSTTGLITWGVYEDASSQSMDIDYLLMTVYYDPTAPTTTINGPASGSWVGGTSFTVDVTNSDTGGSGLGTCYYRVRSNGVYTLGWTSYTCSTDPDITVGSSANCRDQGTNICQVEFYAVDAVNNTGTTVTRQFSIDMTAPTTTINSPASGTWERTNFTVDVTNADTGGSGLGTCYYRILSNSVETLTWTSYTCSTDPTATVGSSAYCLDEGSNMCQVEFYAEDSVGNIGTTVSRQFSVDISGPDVTINSPDASSPQNANFTLDVTNSDTYSSLGTCYYRVLSNSVQTLGWTTYTCTSDPTITVGASANCRDQGTDICQVELYATDSLGNTGTTVSRQFTIDWTPPTQSGWYPSSGSTVGSAPTISLTLNEQGNCRWSLDGDESYANMSDDGDCTGDGTVTASCAVTGLSEGSVTIWIACADNAGNGNGTSDNAALTYTVDTLPPAQLTWDPTKGSIVCDTSQSVTATTDETAYCRWSNSDIDYNSMSNDCTGSGSTSHSCSATGLTQGTDYVHISCKDEVNNKDTSATNEDVNYTVDIVAPSGYSCSTPADSEIDVSMTPTLTAVAGSDVTTISYYFQIAKDSSFSTALQESGWLSGDNDWVPGTSLDSNTVYYWRVKAKDVCGYEGTYSTTYSFTTMQVTPNITFVSFSQATDGSGDVTVTYNVTDYTNDTSRFLIEYSYDETTWYQAYISSASVGTVSNTGVSGGTSTGQITAISTPQTNATFVWATKNASNQDGAYDSEDDTVYIRVTTYDAAQGETETSSAFPVDDKAPANYSCSTPTNGTSGVSINPTLTGAAGTDQNTITYYIEIAKDEAFTLAAQQSGWQAGLTWTPTTLDQGTKYFWHIKARDSFGNEGAYDTPTFEFTTTANEPDVNIDNVAQTSTGGEGYVTAQYDLADPNPGDSCGIYIEYSYDNTNWYKAYILDASIGTVNNSAARQISGLACGTGVSNATFRWATQNAGNGGGAFTGEDITTYLRITPNDGTYTGQIRNSAFFSVDNQAPTAYDLQYPTNGETGVDSDATLMAATATDISTVYYMFRLDKVPADWAAPDYQVSSWQSSNSWTVGTTLDYVTNYEYSVRAKDQYGNTGSYVTSWAFITENAPDNAAWPFTTDTDYTYDTDEISVTSGMAQLRADVDPAWFDTRWTYRKKITVDNTSSSNPLYDYQILVELNSSNFDFSKARSDGGDLRFFDDTGQGTALDYWIQNYDSSGQTARIWVKVPDIPASDEYEVYMYYGYSSATTADSIDDTFTAAQWTDGDTTWTKVNSSSNVTADEDVVLGEELKLDGEVQSLGGTIRKSRIRLVNNSTININDGEILRLYANEIYIEAGSQISGYKKGYAGGAGSIMCIDTGSSSASPWYGGQQIGNNGLFDTTGCTAVTCGGGGGVSFADGTDGRDGRGGGGGGYGGAGGNGENGWQGYNPDPPGCIGNYYVAPTSACTNTYGTSFGSQTDTSIYMGSGGGAGSASCYNNSNSEPMQFSTLAIGGSGGDGGGALLLDAGTITIENDSTVDEIKMDGGIAESGGSDPTRAAGGGAGGGGSGGTIIIRGQNVNITGKLTARGGMGGGFTNYGASGGGGGGGRIKIFAQNLISSGTLTVTGGAVGGNNSYSPNASAGSNGTTYTNTITYSYNSGISDSGYFTTDSISPIFLGKTFTSSHSLPSVATLSYEIRRASDDALLCSITAAQAASGYDISSCTEEDTPIYIYAYLSTTNFPGSAIIADITLDYYTRQTVSTPPSISVGAEQTHSYYSDNPTIRPITSKGIVFAELVSFSETLIEPDTDGEVYYQISNDGTSWYWWNGSNWAQATTYGQTNTAADINAHCVSFDNEIGGGTLYFKAYMHSDGTQKILLDSVDITYVAPPTPDITLLTPSSGVAGTQIVITGTDFGTSQGNSTVTFNGIDAGSATSWSDTSITINAPVGVSTGYVVVTSRNVQSPQEADSIFTVSAPTITSLTPSTAYWADTIVIAGSNFGSTQGGSYVTFYNGKTATCSSWTNTSITCTVPSGAQTGSVKVTTGGGTSAGVTFTLSSDNSTWPFETTSDYTWDSDANVSGGLAYLKSNNSPSWYYTDYGYRRAITIDNTGGSALTNFQVEISLDNTNFSFGNVQTDGKDIRFVDSDGTTPITNYWLESFSATSLTGTIWIKVPSISAATTKTIYMYYGYPGETSSLSSKTNTLIYPTTWTDGNATFTKIGSSSNISTSSGDAKLEYQTNAQSTTCDDTFNISCGADNDSDNTYDSCSNHGGTVTYEKVVQAAVDYTKAGIGDTVTATCTFKSYSGSEWYIYYYNGSSWSQVTAGSYTDASYHTESSSFTVSGNTGEQYVRCIIDRDGENDNCASSGTYYDNDDVRFYVHYKTSGEMTSDTISGFMGGITLSASQTDPDGTGTAQVITYKVLRATDNTALCTTTTVPYDISTCANANEDVKLYASLTTSSVTTTPVVADWTVTYYSRQTATPEPSALVSLSEESRTYYPSDPTVRPASGKGKTFVEVLSFSDILGPDNAGTVKYQISNDGSNWYYWNGSNWVTASGGYTTTNTSTEINTNITQFDDDVGAGTFYFRAYLHSAGSQSVELDGVTINVAQITITEVHNDGTQTSEGDDFIQLYNPFSADYDISGYVIGNDKTKPSSGNEYEYTLPAGSTIPAHGYYLIAKNSAAFISRFSCDASSVHEWGAVFDLKSAGDEVYIKQSAASTTSLDLVVWGTYNGADLPEGSFNGASAAPVSGNGNSIKRITDGYEDGERDGGDADTSPENDENLGATFVVVSPPTPFCTPPTPGTLTISDNSGYTNDSTPPITLTCEDPSGTDCDSNDYMRLACTEAGLSSTSWMPFEKKCNESGYSCTFNITSSTGCSSGDGTKTIYVEYKNNRGNIQATHASDSTVYDTVAPTISAVAVTSDKEAYLCGTSDSCVTLNATTGGTVYFNNLGGEGNGQKMTVTVTWTDNNGSAAMDQFVGPFAFSESPTYDGTNVGPDTSSTGGWNQTYTINSGESDETGLYFKVYDKAGNYKSVPLTFLHDNTDPSITYNSPSAGGVTSWYKTDPGSIINIDFGWSSGSPLAYGQYKIGTGSWTNIFNAYQSSSYTSNWGITWSSVSEGVNQISVQIVDGCGNTISHTYVESTTGFIFRKDTTAPTITGLTITSNNETYFYGTADGVNCTNYSAYPSVTCTVWFNSVSGEGGGQIMTGTLTWYDAASYDRLQGPTMFSQTPDPDTTSSPWSLAYTITSGWSTDQTGKDFAVYDQAGNGQSVKIDYKVDNTDPTVTINSPAASSWHTTDITTSVTNADTGSGLQTCYYRVLSNSVVTQAWTTYTCTGSPPDLTNSTSGMCKDEGADKCQIELYNTDRVGNVGTTVTRTFGIDWSPPSVTFNNPAASTWEGAGFSIDISDSDTGSGLNTCDYMVESYNGSSWSTTQTWTSRTCNSTTSATITVGSGSGYMCQNEGTDTCRVTVRATDNVSKVTTLSARYFSIDWTPPSVTFTSPAASTWEGAAFDINIADSDAGSGLATCEYMVENYDGSSWNTTQAWASRTCNSATSANITVGASAFCINEGADKCRVTVRATDNVGKMTTLTARTFSIDYTAPSVTFNGPAASTWEGSSGFDIDISDSDAGSGLNTCEFMAESYNGSSWTTTQTWTSRTCNSSTSANIAVGSDLSDMCQDEGADKCRITVRATDNVGRVTTLAARTFSIDYTPPSVTFNNPAASAWKSAAFDIDISDSDAGIGLDTCEYMVESYDGSSWVETQAWDARTCNSATSVNITVGSGTSYMCRDEGADKCRVTVRATDSLGNVTTLTGRTFSIDWTGPSVTFNSPAASTWEGAAFDINISDSDAGSGLASCQYLVESYNGSSWVVTHAWTDSTRTCNSATSANITVGSSTYCPDEGTDVCRVTVRATDNLSNVTTLAARTFSIDFTPPSVAFNNPAASTWEGSSGFDIDISDSDAGSGLASCEYMVEDYDGSSWSTTKTWSSRTCNNTASANITVGATDYCQHEGTDVCRITVRATDNVSKVTTLTARTFSIDRTPPAVTFNSPAASTWEGAAFDINISDSDAGSGLASCQYMVESYDGSSWVETQAWAARTCNSSTSANITVGSGNNCPDEGADKCRVTVRATDNVGQITTLTARTFSIDYTPPAVTFNSPAASTWEGAAFDIDISDSDAGSGLASCEYMVEDYDGSSWSTTKAWSSRTCNNTASANITVGATDYCQHEGTDVCRVTVRATDNVGKVTTLTARTFSIDRTPPAVTFNSPAASTWEGVAFDINISDSDAGSGLASCQYMVESYDGSSWVETQAWAARTCNSSTSANITVGSGNNCPDEGADVCRVTVRSTDNVGHTTTLTARTFSIDYTPPAVTFNNPAASAWEGSPDFDIDISDSDAGSGLASCQYMVESYNGSSWVETQAWTGRTCNSSTSASITVGASTYCPDEGADKCRVTVRATDNVGKVTTLTGRTFSIDYTPPSVTFNGPAASTWEGAAFDIDISDSDAGSGLALCQYMVESYDGSSWVETQAWAARTCNSSTSASITVGSGNNCPDEGTNVCRVTVRATDNAGMTTTLAARTFSIDYTPPAVTFNNPAASAWETSNFNINISDSDAGSGLSSCYYMVESYDGSSWTTTRTWTARTCNSATSAAITVGAASDCNTQGADYCCVSVRATDNVGKVTTLSCRPFGIDYTAPVISAITLTSSKETYFYGTSDALDCSNVGAYPSVTCTAWFNSLASEGSGQIITAAVTWTDNVQRASLSGTAAFGDTPAPDTVAPLWTIQYSVEDNETDQTDIDFTTSDSAGNTDAVKIDFKVDNTIPTVTINSPAASSWQGANFTPSVTESDSGAGIASTGCYYRVTSNSVVTLPWGSYTCSTDPTILVNNSSGCDTQGTDICQIDYYAVDRVGNTSTTASLVVGIDWEPPTVTINSPAASSWQGPDFTVDVTNADSGSGVDVCEYKVVSNSVTTLDWATYTCSTDPIITVGSSEDCDVEGTDICEVSFRVTDKAGRVSSTASRTFSIDWTPPIVVTGAYTESSDYLWISPSNNKLYYGTGMGSAQQFTVNGTASDARSGLDYAAFSTSYGDSPADDTTAANWTATYDIDSSNTTADTITVTVYDVAGNSATATFTPIHDNTLSIEYLDMSPTGPPAYLQFKLYYPDGVTEMTTGSPTGIYPTITAGSDVSKFFRIYNRTAAEMTIYDDVNDAVDGTFVIQTFAYQSGCGMASGTAWCLELYTVGCASCMLTPHHLSVSTTSDIKPDAFYVSIPEEKTIDGDFGAMPPGRPPYIIGDPGTVEIGSGPDHVRVVPQDDSLVTADSVVSSWCSCGVCCPTCSAGYCSSAPSIIEKPDFVKVDSGSGANLLTNVADNTAPGSGEWSWDTTNLKIILGDDPSSSTVYVTLKDQSEVICAELIDGCGKLIDEGGWSGATVRLTLSQAPDSGMDITRNDSSATQGFASVSPADFTPPDQLQIEGDIIDGKACMTITAASLPSDSPQTPIKITPTYLGATPLSHKSGEDIPAYVLIRESTGVASGTTSLGGTTNVDVSFISTPDNAAKGIVLSPTWRQDGSRLAFVSRQANPCSGNAATGDSVYENFNVYIMEQSGGTLTGCTRLTANATDFSDDYGVAPYSQIAWSESSDRVIFAASDMMGTARSKLFWVSATSTYSGAATGTQFDYPPAGPLLEKIDVWDDISAGTSSININYSPTVQFGVGNKILVYETDIMTGAIINREIKTVTAITQDPMNSITNVSVTPSMVNSYTGTLSGGTSYVEYPITLRSLSQNMVSLDDSAEWFDPDMSGDYAECDASYRNKLIAVRAPADSSEDTLCDPACSTDGYSSTNANIVMIDGATADGVYKIDGVTSNLSRITAFTPSDNSIWPMKPKWSPDCKMIAFLAWDRTPNNDFPTAPSKTSVYIINLDATYSGFATATLPIQSLSDTGVYKIYDYSSKNAPAYSPNWSADGKLVSYSIDRNNLLDLASINSGMGNIVLQMFTNSNFDSYLEYILDQPEANGAVIAPQLVGQVSSNELDLAQCPSNAASTCTNKPNTPYVQVAQMSSSEGAYLRLLTMDNNSTVTSDGGLLFQDGIVTAVFPPNVLASDTVFYNTDPTTYCGGSGIPDCPVDPTTDYIVQAGEAREYFPDGTNFESYVRLIFHYCDNDDDGYVDAGTENIVSATSNGTKSFNYNSLTGECTVDGVATSGGTIHANAIGVYNWDTTSSSWVRMDGVIDTTAKTLTVFSKHFSRYDTLGFRMGYQASTLTPLQLIDVHTYPNPYVAANNIADGITFTTQDVIAGTGENVTFEIKVYDLRGSLVTTLAGTTNEADTHENNGHTLYKWRPVTNASGRTLASGVYVYYLVAHSTNYEATHKGTFSVVR